MRRPGCVTKDDVYFGLDASGLRESDEEEGSITRGLSKRKGQIRLLESAPI